jgi:hypothetical protein
VIAQQTAWLLSNQNGWKVFEVSPLYFSEITITMNSTTAVDLFARTTVRGLSEYSARNADCELTRRIDTLTFRQVRDLNIAQDADRVILRGRAKSYYVKQLATHAVLDLMPGADVENSICVVN